MPEEKNEPNKEQKAADDSIERMLNSAAARSNLKMMSEFMADEDNIRLTEMQAVWLYTMFDSYIKAGFNESQTMYLCGEIVKSHYGRQI